MLLNMRLERLFREIYKNHVERTEYLDCIPRDINTFVVDNAYAVNMDQERDMLIKAIFGIWAESVEWFLYEWEPGYEVSIHGISTKIYNIDEYIDWIKKEEGFDCE